MGNRMLLYKSLKFHVIYVNLHYHH